MRSSVFLEKKECIVGCGMIFKKMSGRNDIQQKQVKVLEKTLLQCIQPHYIWIRVRHNNLCDLSIHIEHLESMS